MLKTLQALYRCQLLTGQGIWHLLNSIRTDGMNLMALLYVRQKLSPLQTAIDTEDSCIDYRTLYLQSRHLADQLAIHCAIKPHQKIAVMASNHIVQVHTVFALAALGADIYLLNTELSASQLQSIHHDVQFDWIIHDPEITVLPTVKTLPTYHQHLVSVHSLLTTPVNPQPVKRKPTHFSKITVLTSGTTGRFKLAGRSSRAKNFLSPFSQLLVQLNLSLYKKVYIATPIYHGFGMATLCMSVLLGATIFLTRRFHHEKACQLIAANQIEVVTLVPLMLTRMMYYCETQLQSLRCIITGGAPITPALVTQVLNRLGKILFNLYGTSEAGVCMIASPQDLAIQPSTIGKPLQGLSAKLLLNPTANDTQGELHIKCAWSALGKRWVGTGDLAYKDTAGYYYLQGRIDDMIVSAGENVYPFELENSLLNHPQITDTAVISVPDQEFGQRLVAFIVLNPASNQNELTIKDWLKPRLPVTRCPKKLS